MDIAKILDQDPAFAEQAAAVETPEEVIRLWSTKGVTMDTAAAEAYLETIRNQLEEVPAVSDELSEDALDQVAGGGILGAAIGAAAGVVVGCYVVVKSKVTKKKTQQAVIGTCMLVGAAIGGLVIPY